MGCGDSTDAEIFIKEIGLDVYGADIYRHEYIDKLRKMKFQQANIYVYRLKTIISIMSFCMISCAISMNQVKAMKNI